MTKSCSLSHVGLVPTHLLPKATASTIVSTIATTSFGIADIGTGTGSAVTAATGAGSGGAVGEHDSSLTLAHETERIVVTCVTRDRGDDRGVLLKMLNESKTANPQQVAMVVMKVMVLW
jgi:outer membrane lipoprotein SlyB